METFLKELRINWVLILAIVGIIVGWTQLNSRLVQAETDLVRLEVIALQIQQIQLDLAVIKEHISNIDEKLK